VEYREHTCEERYRIRAWPPWVTTVNGARYGNLIQSASALGSPILPCAQRHSSALLFVRRKRIYPSSISSFPSFLPHSFLYVPSNFLSHFASAKGVAVASASATVLLLHNVTTVLRPG